MQDSIVAQVAHILKFDEQRLHEMVARCEQNDPQGLRPDAETVNRAIAEYYPDSDLARHNLSRYEFAARSRTFSTWLATAQDWCGLQISAGDTAEASELLPIEPFSPSIAEADVAPYLAAILNGKGRNWDNPIYRLVYSEVRPATSTPNSCSTAILNIGLPRP